MWIQCSAGRIVERKQPPRDPLPGTRWPSGTSRRRSHGRSLHGNREISRLASRSAGLVRVGKARHARVSDLAGSDERSRSRVLPHGLPPNRRRRHPELSFFRGSMAGLHTPLPTLRRHHRGCLRTARGRCGSLLLHRSGLAPPTPCRLPQAPVEKLRFDGQAECAQPFGNGRFFAALWP